MKNLLFISFFVFACVTGSIGQSSISLVGNARWGSQRIPFFIDEFGNKVTLSTGSGITAGGGYSYDLTWLFNVSSDIMLHYSNLSKKAKNANGHFIGMETHLTPSLTLPAREDPGIKVLIGAGPGLYTFQTIKINAKGAGGENMTFKYKPAIGYHAQILFRLKFQDEYFTIGGRYYMVSYTYKEKGSSHFSTDNRINNPNGSGFALYVSISN